MSWLAATGGGTMGRMWDPVGESLIDVTGYASYCDCLEWWA